MRVTIDHDGDTRLSVTAHALGFGGTTEFWWWDSEDLSRFAAELASYPLAADRRVVFVGGYGDRVDEGLEHEYVRLEVHPIGSFGQVGVVVKLSADSAPPHLSIDAAAISHEARLEVLTTYERLRQFSLDLLRIAEGRATEARLEEEWLG